MSAMRRLVEVVVDFGWDADGSLQSFCKWNLTVYRGVAGVKLNVAESHGRVRTTPLDSCHSHRNHGHKI